MKRLSLSPQRKSFLFSLLALCASVLLLLSSFWYLGEVHEDEGEEEDSFPAIAAQASPRPTPAPTSAPTDTPAPTPAPTPFALVWLSDTQVYTWRYPDVFKVVCQWLADNKEAENIVATVHSGDVIDNRNEEDMWIKASAALALMKGKMPLYVVAGNHDVGWTAHPEYERFLGMGYLDIDDPELLFEGGQCWIVPLHEGGFDILLLGLGWTPREGWLDWAKAQLDKYPHSTVIIVTHSALYPNGTLTAEGELLERELFQAYKNIRLVVSGHSRGELKWRKTYADGHTVDVLLWNLQDEHVLGQGKGYLRIIRFDPIARSAEFISYSPYLNEYNYFGEARDHFTLENFLLGAD